MEMSGRIIKISLTMVTGAVVMLEKQVNRILVTLL